MSNYYAKLSNRYTETALRSNEFEQNTCIKFYVKFGKSAIKMIEMLNQVFLANTRTRIYEWHVHFKGDRVLDKETVLSGRPNGSRSQPLSNSPSTLSHEGNQYHRWHSSRQLPEKKSPVFWGAEEALGSLPIILKVAMQLKKKIKKFKIWTSTRIA